MKVTRMLEVLSGLGYFVSAVFSLYIIDFPIYQGFAEENGELNWHFWSSGPILFLIILSLIVAVSSYFHAFRKSYVALAIILILGGFFLCMNIISILAGRGSTHFWIKTSLFIFLLATIVLAGINTIAHLQHKQNLSRIK